MRIILFTGKGGVGKTTVAGATALHCAEAGHRTLVVSTDPAHSLSDAFELPLGPEPAPLAANLWGQQLDAQQRLEASWAEIGAYVARVLDWAGVEPVVAEELAVVPGLDEVFALADIKAHAASGEWDVIVVDCGPTAETLRLLSLPEVLSRYMERLFPLARAAARVAGPLLGGLTGLPAVGDDVFDALRRFYDRLEGVQELLSDPATTSVRLVLNPERMVIAEARRTFTYLSLFGYPVDAVIANRLLPTAVDDPWFSAWKHSQSIHLQTIDEGFTPVPVLRVELADAEINGQAALSQFAKGLYGELDAAAVLHDGLPFTVERRAGERVLSIGLAFADRDEVELARREDELLLKVGPYRRAVLLPDSLRRRRVLDAALLDGRLEVVFAEEER